STPGTRARLRLANGRLDHEARRLRCAGHGLIALLVVLAGCSTSKDAVETGGSFQFVAPGGKTELTYDPPSSRGTVRAAAGRSLAGLGGVPRNVVPLTVVLDKQLRVAFVSLVPVQVAKLVPLVQRLATE